MVSLTQRDSFMLEVQQDPELRPLRAFIFGERVNEPIPGATTRSRLFDALRANDSRQFRELLTDLERRKLSPDSEWIGDDCVVFLLLLGVSKFNVGVSFVDKLLQCRSKTTNAQVQRVNYAFDAIRRQEFAMEGECAFIKCVYRTLAQDWLPSDADSIKLYKQLTLGGFVEQLDPFLRLLAIRAFDLVIERRVGSLEGGSWNQVLQKLQDDGAKLSLGQFLALLKHLRVGVLLALVLGVITVFGAGEVWSWRSSKQNSPERVTISGVLPFHTKLANGTNGWFVPFAHYLDETGAPSRDLTAITLNIEADPFTQPTERFTAKGTVLLFSNLNAFCFLMHPVGGVTSSIPVQVLCVGNEFSASVPPSEPGDQLQFLVRGLTSTNLALDALPTRVRVSVGP
jgi:hypothetical protein